MKPPSQVFSHVPVETTQFLADLEKNNTKEWFDAHREEYEKYWVDVGLQLVCGLGEGLRSIEPKIAAEPKINGSIFRIHRDTRFSKDKTPYKTHLDLWFWDDCKKKEAQSGFWLRIQSKTWGIGVGNYGFSKEALQTYREAVADKKKGRELLKAIRSATDAGFEVHGEKYKRMPAGFDIGDDEERATLLRHGHLTVGNTAMKHPSTLRSPAFLQTCLEHYKALQPVHRWLKGTLQS